MAKQPRGGVPFVPGHQGPQGPLLGFGRHLRTLTIFEPVVEA